MPFQPQPPPICPTDSPTQNSHSWCTFQTVDYKTVLLECIYLPAVTLIAIVLIKFQIKLTQYMNQQRYKYYFGDFYKWVYRIVAAWLISTYFKVFISLLAFFLYMKGDFDEGGVVPDYPDPEISDSIVKLASVYTFFNFCCAFFVNLLTLLIPYQWLIIMLLNLNSSTFVETEQRQLIQKWLRILAIVKVYWKFLRFGFLILLIVQPFMFFVTQVGRCKSPKINTICIFAESIIIVSLYIFVLYVSKWARKNKYIKIQQYKDSLLIKFQFASFYIVSLTRVFWNFSRIVPIFQDYQLKPNGHCSNMNQSYLYNVILLSVHHGVMHLLPIILILYIFRPNISGLKKYDELIDIQDSFASTEAREVYKEIMREFYKSSLKDNEKKKYSQITEPFQYS